MHTSKSRIAVAVLWAGVATAVVGAHPMTYQGTVLTVEPSRLHVKTIDDKTKKEEQVWFVLDKDTKVRRGDRTVPYA